MSSEPKAEGVGQSADGQQEASPVGVGWAGKIEGQYRKMKEHAETYPYVWGSYILVYGGFGLWLTYRWRRLRGTEDRVRALQQRLRELVEAEQSANSSAAGVVTETKKAEQSANSSAAVTEMKKASPPADKAT